MSVSQSFHIKGPELIESIRLTENGVFQTEFEKRDIAASKIQSWWRTKHNNVKIHTNLRELLAKNRRKFVDNSPSILADRESFRKRLIKKKSPVSARVPKQTRFSDDEKSSPPKSSRAFNPAIDDVRGVKFSARVQSSRKHIVTENPSLIENGDHNDLPKPSLKQSPPLSKSSNISTNKNAVTKSHMRTITSNIVVSQKEQKAAENKVKAENVDDQLDSLMSALDKLENPTQQKLTHSVFQSQTDLKLARLEANLREIESKEVQSFQDHSRDFDVISAKAAESQKMMHLMLDENELEKEQFSKQVDILHSALKQQRDQNKKTLEDQEKMFNEERKRLNDNFTQQHERQLNFIDQLIKDKQGLADQVTSLVKKIENDEISRSKEKNELLEKHKVEINAIRDKLTAAEKLRREKWVEAKQKEIKALTVKGLEPEIARLIARHKQELRNIKAQHEAEILAADERAARRWADQQERLRQNHENDKIELAEKERKRAQERVQRQLEESERETTIIRERLQQEKILEKERQNQHIEYLKDSHKTQIKNMEQLHAENLEASAAEWKLKFEDVQKRSKLELQMQRENFEQQISKHKQDLEVVFQEKSNTIENELREKVKIERDAEIERAVNRIETEMESVRLNAEQTANNKILRVQEKMQRDVDAAEKSESEAHQKYTEAKQKVNDLSEELMAEKHKLNLTAAELNQKEDRLDKLLSERHRVSEVIREEFADRLVLLEREIAKQKTERAEHEARFKQELSDKDRLRKEEIGALNERVQRALKVRDEENSRLTQVAEQAQRRADYMEEMLDKQNKLIREKKMKK